MLQKFLKIFFLSYSLIFSSFAGQVREIGFDVGTLKTQGSTPSNPAAGKNKIYVKDGNLKLLDNAGAERNIGASSSTQELLNGDFEATASSWTVLNATPSAETSNMFEGKKSLSLALTGALSLSQSSTINAARKLGVQMVASLWVKSDDVSDLQLCSLKNGAEDKCTVTGGYVQGSGWRQLTVSFLGDSTSNGLKLKSTDTTGTVLVDQAFVGVGSPIVDFTPDMVYSAKISATGGILSQNTDFIASCTNANPIVCAFKPNEFTVAPVCSAVIDYGGAGAVTVRASSISSSSVSFERFDLNTAISNGGVMVVCQKQGADYKTSKAYVASGSVALNTTVYSAKISSTGVVSGESIDWINGNCSSSSGSYTCTFTSGIFTVTPNCFIQVNDVAGGFGYTQNLNTSNESKVDVYTRSSAGTLTPIPFQLICQKQGADYTAAFNPVIVGSFQGYNETPGTSRVETFKYNFYGATPTTACSSGTCTTKQIGTNVSKVERTALGTYLNTFSKAYSAIQCVIDGVSGASTNIGYSKGYYCENCNSLSMLIANANNTALNDGWGFVDCQGIPQ